MEGGKLAPSGHANLCKKSRLCMIALLVLDASPLSLVGLLILRRSLIPTVSLDTHLLVLIGL